MLDKALKPNTINGKISTLQQFFKFIYQDGQTETNLAERLLPIKNDRKMIHTFTEVQVQRILAAVDQTSFTGLRDYAILLLFLETGMRVIEMTNLAVGITGVDGACHIFRHTMAKMFLINSGDILMYTTHTRVNVLDVVKMLRVLNSTGLSTSSTTRRFPWASIQKSGLPR